MSNPLVSIIVLFSPLWFMLRTHIWGRCGSRITDALPLSIYILTGQSFIRTEPVKNIKR